MEISVCLKSSSSLFGCFRTTSDSKAAPSDLRLLLLFCVLELQQELWTRDALHNNTSREYAILLLHNHRIYCWCWFNEIIVYSIRWLCV